MNITRKIKNVQKIEEFTNDILLNKLFTLHLKIKKLSMNSPGDFDSVLDTINHY